MALLLLVIAFTVGICVYANSDELLARQIINKAKEIQTDFCLNPKKYEIPELDSSITIRSIDIDGARFAMYVYDDGDIVSNEIIIEGAWEKDNSYSMQFAFKDHARVKKIDKRNAIFLDIGANIGWYTLYMGSLGYNVIAFEPAPKNVYIMRKNLCLNPQINAVLIEKGVGDQEKRCKIVSSKINVGDGIIDCNDDYKSNVQYSTIGEAHIIKLDMFANYFQNVRGIKMDIESYEPFAILGGKSIFYSKNTQFIQMEYQHKHMQKHGINPSEFFSEFKKHGFEIRSRSFNGPRIDIQQMLAQNKFPDELDMFLTKIDAFD